MAAQGNNSLTLATKITVIRVLLIPAFIICLTYKKPGFALTVFLLASLADAVDGYLARRRGEMTPLGALLDPIADKLLIFSAYVLMGTYNLIPQWLAIVVVSRDVLICAAYMALSFTVRFVTPSPSILGKATTVAQMATVLAALAVAAGGMNGAPGLAFLYWLAGGLTIASGLHYVFFVGARMLSPKDSAISAGESSPATALKR